MENIRPETNTSPLISAKELQEWGFSRVMAYQLLNRKDLPLVKIGGRKFLARAKFVQLINEGKI